MGEPGEEKISGCEGKVKYLMPNYCNNAINFCSLKKERLEELLLKIKQVKSTSLAELAYICTQEELEVDLRDRISYCDEEIQAKGSIYYFRIDTETAGQPHMEVWNKLLKAYPGICYYYCSEEPAMDIYETNDGEKIFFTDRYKIEYLVADREKCCYLSNRLELLAAVQKITGVTCEPNIELKKMQASVNKVLQGESEYLSIMEFVVK